jgi:aminocarboxymuconate-semialdehyde decarboxylase
MHDRGGELFLGEVPLSISAAAMSDITAVREDMRATGVGVRVLSAPPFAFPVGGGNSVDYVRSFNDALADVVAGSDGALIGLGMVSLEDAETCRTQLAALADTPGIAGIAIPPVLAGGSLDRGMLREILVTAADLALAVLIHPMQLPRPEWSEHYLANLIGNPTETATAVAAVLLGGLMEELPLLRVCFVHGGGCAPGLLGRWEHGWHSRADVRTHSKRPPSDGFRDLFFDTVTHDADLLRLLSTKAGAHGIVCGSDYPFDMAQQDPVRFAVANGLSAEALTTNGRAFLGL